MKSSQSSALPIFFYCALALSLSLGILRFNYFITPDGVYYARAGESLLAGRGISVNAGEPYFNHPPFYPLAIGLLNLFTKNLELAGHLISVAAFSLTVIPLFLLAKEVYSARAAHWASLLYLTNEFLLNYSNAVLTEPLFTLLIMTNLYVIHKVLRKKVHSAWPGVLTGFLSGLAYLTRPEGVLFFAVGGASLFFLSPKGSLPRFRTVLASIAVFSVFLVPYVCFVEKYLGRPYLSGLAPANVLYRHLDLSHPGQWRDVKKNLDGLTPDKSDLKIWQLVREFGTAHFRSQDLLFFLREGIASFKWRFLDLAQILFRGLGFLLVAASFLARPWTLERKKSEVLLLGFLLPLISYVFLFFDVRHFFTFLPLFLIWMGNGIEALSRRLSGVFVWGERGRAGFASALCVLFVMISFFRLHRNLSHLTLPVEQRELGLWMKANLPEIERERVAAYTPFVNFYSGAKILKLPYVEGLEDLFIYLRTYQTKYFVVSEKMDSHYQESYGSLLDEARPLPAELVRVRTASGRKKTVLFKLAD